MPPETHRGEHSDPLLSLNEDTFLNVLKQLGARDLLSASNVSRPWRQFIANTSLYRKAYLELDIDPGLKIRLSAASRRGDAMTDDDMGDEQRDWRALCVKYFGTRVSWRKARMQDRWVDLPNIDTDLQIGFVDECNNTVNVHDDYSNHWALDRDTFKVKSAVLANVEMGPILQPLPGVGTILVEVTPEPVQMLVFLPDDAFVRLNVTPDEPDREVATHPGYQYLTAVSFINSPAEFSLAVDGAGTDSPRLVSVQYFPPEVEEHDDASDSVDPEEADNKPAVLRTRVWQGSATYTEIENPMGDLFIERMVVDDEYIMVPNDTQVHVFSRVSKSYVYSFPPATGNMSDMVSAAFLSLGFRPKRIHKGPPTARRALLRGFLPDERGWRNVEMQDLHSFNEMFPLMTVHIVGKDVVLSGEVHYVLRNYAKVFREIEAVPLGDHEEPLDKRDRILADNAFLVQTQYEYDDRDPWSEPPEHQVIFGSDRMAFIERNTIAVLEELPEMPLRQGDRPIIGITKITGSTIAMNLETIAMDRDAFYELVPVETTGGDRKGVESSSNASEPEDAGGDVRNNEQAAAHTSADDSAAIVIDNAATETDGADAVAGPSAPTTDTTEDQPGLGRPPGRPGMNIPFGAQEGSTFSWAIHILAFDRPPQEGKPAAAATAARKGKGRQDKDEEDEGGHDKGKSRKKRKLVHEVGGRARARLGRSNLRAR